MSLPSLYYLSFRYIVIPLRGQLQIIVYVCIDLHKIAMMIILVPYNLQWHIFLSYSLVDVLHTASSL